MSDSETSNSKKEPLIQKKDDTTNNLSILLAVMIFITGVFISASKILSDHKNIAEVNDNSVLLQLILIAITYCIIYLVYLVFAIMLNFLVLSKKESSFALTKLLGAVVNLAYSGMYATIYLISFTIAMTLLAVFFIISPKFAIVLGIIVLVIYGLLFSFVLYFRKSVSNEIELKSFYQKSMNKFMIFLLLILFVFIFLYLFITIYDRATYYSSGFDVVYDKEFYQKDDTFFAKVYGHGIISPQIINITYSNHRYLVKYVNNSNFPGAPAYFFIPSDQFELGSYNSVITINYYYRPNGQEWYNRFLTLFGAPNNPRAVKSYFVPILNYSKKENNVDTSLNIVNNSINLSVNDNMITKYNQITENNESTSSINTSSNNETNRSDYYAFLGIVITILLFIIDQIIKRSGYQFFAFIVLPFSAIVFLVIYLSMSFNLDLALIMSVLSLGIIWILIPVLVKLFCIINKPNWLESLRHKFLFDLYVRSSQNAEFDISSDLLTIIEKKTDSYNTQNAKTSKRRVIKSHAKSLRKYLTDLINNKRFFNNNDTSVLKKYKVKLDNIVEVSVSSDTIPEGQDINTVKVLNYE